MRERRTPTTGYNLMIRCAAGILERYRDMGEGVVSLCDYWLDSAGDGWRPIETAPKDGSDVLVTYKNCDSWFLHSAFWLEDEDEPENTGWWSYLLTEVSRTQLDGCCEPTHWRPLPAPPNTREGEAP